MKEDRKIFNFIFLAVFVSALFFISVNVLAADLTFTPQITIPGSEIFKKGVPFTISDEIMPTLVSDLYRFLVGITGIAAVIMMMAGGYYWLFSGGNAGRVTQAKEYIGGAAVGLLLSVGSYMILNMINPNLVDLANFKIKPVPKFVSELGIIECGIKGLTKPDADIKGLGISNNMLMSKPYFNKELIAALEKAAADADSQGFQLIINSGTREPLDQKFLYEKAVKEYGKDAGKYACDGDGNGNFCSCPHVAGNAADVCMVLKNSKNLASGTGCEGGAVNKNMNGKNPVQKTLQEIMQKAGFSRLCAEWWHFELPRMSESCAPGVYK